MILEILFLSRLAWNALLVIISMKIQGSLTPPSKTRNIYHISLDPGSIHLYRYIRLKQPLTWIIAIEIHKWIFRIREVSRDDRSGRKSANNFKSSTFEKQCWISTYHVMDRLLRCNNLSISEIQDDGELHAAMLEIRRSLCTVQPTVIIIQVATPLKQKENCFLMIS